MSTSCYNDGKGHRSEPDPGWKLEFPGRYGWLENGSDGHGRDEDDGEREEAITHP